jgi:hydroxymethylbilane synthase
MNFPLLRIASRGSALALTQARLARRLLAEAQGWDMDDLNRIAPILTFRTTGDRIQDRPLAELGGKGLFAKEIEDALLQDEADIAVHSMKDLPAVQPKGLVIAAVLKREDPRDVFLGKTGGTFGALPPGARIGTSSVRRAAQALRLRPDLSILLLRGNVETRLAKLGLGEVDGMFLARAGLVRLGLLPPSAEMLGAEHWLPALCQGAIGLEIRETDMKTAQLAASVNDTASHLAAECERGFLTALDGSCRTPIAGLAECHGATLAFRGEVLTLDGRLSWSAARAVPLPLDADAAGLVRVHEAGREAAEEIRNAAGADLPRF